MPTELNGRSGQCTKRAAWYVPAIAALALSACAADNSPHRPAPAAAYQSSAESADSAASAEIAIQGSVSVAGSSTRQGFVPAVVRSSERPALVVSGADEAAPSARLAELLARRQADGAAPDFPIGPGDVVSISMPQIEQLKEVTSRVSGKGAISLPLIGDVPVAGLTELEMENELSRRLRRYVYKPQVHVFVKEYQSRQMAVLGAVKNPGLYSLTSRSDTILEVIGRAGGMTEEAGGRALLLPAEPHAAGFTQVAVSTLRGDDSGNAVTTILQHDTAGTGGSGIIRPESSSKAVRPQREVPLRVDQIRENGSASYASMSLREDPIILDLVNADARLNVPARPGDVVIVPVAGEVMVEGWVKNPGAFKISPGMTVLGAVAAAGGEMFSSSAEVLRLTKDGQKIGIPVDLNAAKRSGGKDVPLQSGDVVIVKTSTLGTVPYLLYTLLDKFSTGAYIPMVP